MYLFQSLTWFILTCTQLKRQHSADPMNGSARKSPATAGSPKIKQEAETTSTIPPLDITNHNLGNRLPDDAIIGSPLKKQRANEDGTSENTTKFPPPISNVLGLAEAAQATANQSPSRMTLKKDEEEEELSWNYHHPDTINTNHAS